MQVDARGAGARMSHAGHEIRQRRSGLRSQRVSRVAEIVKVNAAIVEAGSRDGPSPMLLEVAPSGSRALRPGEEQRVAVGSYEGVEMLAQLVEQAGGRATMRRPAAVLGGPTIS